MLYVSSLGVCGDLSEEVADMGYSWLMQNICGANIAAATFSQAQKFKEV